MHVIIMDKVPPLDIFSVYGNFENNQDILFGVTQV